MEMTITHSDIKAFLRCRRSWYWSYVADFRAPEKLYGPLALGTRVHQALEIYYRDGKDAVEAFNALATADVEHLSDYSAYDWELDRLYEDIIIGRNCVELHQKWLATSGADSGYEIVGVEEKISCEIIPGVTLLTKADVLMRDLDTGFLWINDLKTDGGWDGSTREMLERSWQPTTYGIAATLAMPEEIIGGAFFTVMRKVKRPERSTKQLVDRWNVPAGRRVFKAKHLLLQQIARDMVATVKAIGTEGAARHAYPVPGLDCKWCEFRHPCEIVDESAEAAEAMLDAQFVRGRKHARYDI